MFDIGFSELLVIAVVALVVLGPERLPKAARFAGLWVRRARNQWDSVKQELERELQAEELKRQMQDVRQGMQDTEAQLRASGEAVRREMQRADAHGQALAEDVRAPAAAEAPPHTTAPHDTPLATGPLPPGAEAPPPAPTTPTERQP
ncbi:Sec-independent protein translocase protein TatB [Stenotrophomonas sp. 24(2023)]|uniref:Sec-independent protein translocase protein TatB n=1 Tax=Stenotrophomonas sp. 24(2023) TaxID=3068324 RepID=UPI0027DEC6DB|nr:Sec-independent protein translocase protein TatB [Stenotrophomonas sp. 24(2023)]WMJ71020.1 Sec-independent protein translocase protein TatB [Stenotrophomonas sp. 24(2023)]